MCRACLTAHLDQVVTGLQAQLSSKIGCLEFRVDPCQMCSPTAVAKPVVRPCARVFRFPGSLPRCRSFVRTLRVIGIVLGNLKANKVVTSRDIYYQDVVLFGNQRNVVSAIASLTRLLGVPRESLGVMPSPNGLLAGDMTIALEDGDIVETRRRNGATLIPVQPILYVMAAKPPEFILVVEKEAVFSYLQWELPEAIVVTGRGFPDRATSNMVRALSLSYPEVPIYGLVDSDPHGVLICRNYECGSPHTGEEQIPVAVQYLGVELLEYTAGLVPCTPTDLRLAVSTLKKDWVHLPENTAFKTELQRGLFTALKSEMNLMDQDQGRKLSQYVRDKVRLVRKRRRPFARQPALVQHEA